MPAFEYINTRRELKQMLRERMVDSYDSVATKQELHDGQTYLKSYLIESNRSSLSEGTVSLGDQQLHISETQEPGFVRATAQTDDGRVYFFIDKLNERFWSIHTVAKATVSDKIIKRIIFPRFTELDYPWLSNGFLERVGKQPEATFRAFSVKFEDEFHEITENSGGVEGLSMRLWGNSADEVLDTLRTNQNISGSTSLSNVGIKKEFGERVLLSDITYQSKFTARGESVEGHLSQVRNVMEDYYTILDKVENEYSMYTERRGSGTHIDGHPLLIDFDREIENLREFVDELFSSTNPFRLWGIVDEVEEDYYTVAGVDMHTGDKIDFEVCPNWIRIYLPKGSCGNVVMRLYTNIQHYYDSKSTLEGEDSEQLI
ncbi:hypothetical protein [Haloarchaeobius sp. HME9146]|uniref:hypothetical protein n=1 Tax=Haloarchaeobius sp. HME9146 TaxID=2978732 RepID=UPI0021BE4205|nr:hypothetical protein [Haloarchaeobius sp. HME9146]MCT9096825.1 hypothetical protein [Haloarchaeobius sp. HME9146]